MSLHFFNQQSVRQSIAQAYALKQQGYYAAAKSLIRPHLESHPQDAALQALYQRIDQLQRMKDQRYHCYHR